MVPPISNGARSLELMSGAMVGSYKVDAFIARGSKAFVYAAKDQDNKKVALKFGDVAARGEWTHSLDEIPYERSHLFLSPDESPSHVIFIKPDTGFESTFLSAAEVDGFILKQHEILTRAKHPNIVRLKGAGLERYNDRPILVMEKLEGETLREKMRLLHGIRVAHFEQIANALLKLKDSGKLDAHRNIKPENIIISRSGKVTLLDPSPHPDEFNGRLITSAAYNPLLLTDFKADVMALGIILYEIYTGVCPFGQTPYPRAHNRSGEDYESLALNFYLSIEPMRYFNPDPPEEMSAIVNRCIQDPDYGLRDFCEELAKFLRTP